MASSDRPRSTDGILKSPAHLRAEGRRLWAKTVEAFDLAEHELVILEACCREADVCRRLEDELRNADLTVRGSTGQTVANPLLAELRLHRSTLSSLLVRLGLPADADDERARAAGRSASARDLAAARWQRTG